MSKTLGEIRDHLIQHYDPIDLLEIFQLTTEEILDRFEDKMVYYYDTLNENIELEELPYDDSYRYPGYAE